MRGHRPLTAEPAPADVAATTTPAGAAAVRWHAIIVGGGPAGSATARRLAARGLRVLLVDAGSMPRPKLCGCCLSLAAVVELSMLAELGGRDARPLPLGAVQLTRVRLAAPAVSAVLPLPGGAVVSREALDAAGVRAAIAGGSAWLPRTRVVAVHERDGGEGPVRVELAGDADGGGPLRCDVVVVAAGLADAIRVAAGPPAAGSRPAVAPASRLGVGTVLDVDAGPPPGELVMAVSRGGYCGLVRLEDGRLDLAAALDREALAEAGSPAAAIAGLLAETGGDRAAGFASAGLADRLAEATFRGTPPLTRSGRVATPSGRTIRVGDAAGYAEPFTGEGIGWALASARLLDEALGPALAGHEPARDLAAAAGRYAALHAGHFSSRHTRCLRVARAVRRPWLVRSAVRLARQAPALAARAVPLVVGAPSPRKVPE